MVIKMFKVWVADATDAIDHGHILVESDAYGKDVLDSYGPWHGTSFLSLTPGFMNECTGADIQNDMSIQLNKGNNLSVYTLNLKGYGSSIAIKR